MKTHSHRVGIRTCSDYSPFGVELDGRTVSGGYRFGYQGSEKDDELKGNGNSYTTEFRQLDPRLGRWLSIDPLFAKFPWQSPYIQSNNNPTIFSDNKGLEAEDWIKIREKRGDKYVNKVVYDSNITTDEGAKEKYGQNASKLEYGFQYHSEFNDQITLLENGTYDVNGSMREATDLNSTGVSTEGNNGEKSGDQSNNSIMQQFIGDPNSSNHIDWNIDPSKHHYMYDFDDKMQKGCFNGALCLSTGALSVEAASVGFLTSALVNSSTNFLSQYASLNNVKDVDYASVAISFGTSLISNPWMSAGLSTGLDVSLDIDGTGKIKTFREKSNSNISYDLFFGSISNFSGATIHHLNIKNNIGIPNKLIELRNNITGAGSQFLNTEINKK